MYENTKKEKNFTFEQIIKSDNLSLEQTDALMKKYNIKEVVGKSNLVVEKFSNDTDESLDYDITLQIQINEETKSYTLKTSDSLDNIEKKYNEIINQVSQI